MKCEEHNKSFAPYMLASNPPRIPWICRECGEQGSDQVGVYEDIDEYDKLVHKQTVRKLAEKCMDRNAEAFRRLAESETEELKLSKQ